MKKTTPENRVAKKHSKYYVDDRCSYHLTRRESECLLYILQALSAKEIARQMNITTKTAEQYVAVIKEKLGCKSKSELIVKAIKNDMTNILQTWVERK